MNTKTKRYKTLAKDTGLFAISSFGSKILLFLLTPLYTSVLLTEEYGIADILVTTIDFVYPILTLAISEAVLRFALQKDISKESVFTTSMAFVLGSSLLIFILWPIIGAFNETIDEYYLFFVLMYLFYNIHNVFANFVKGIEKTKIFAIQGILQTVTVIASNILFLIGLKWAIKGYLLSIIFGYIVSISFMLLVGKLYSYWDIKSFDKAVILDMLKYSIPMIPTILAWAINTSIDKYMIIGFVGVGENGIYSVAHKIPSLITTVFLVFIQAWQISAINAHGQNDESEFYTSTYTVLNALCVGCVAVIIPLTKIMSGLLFSKDFYVAWRFVPFLCLSAVFSSLAGFLAAGFRAAKKTTNLFVSVAIGAVINIILNLLFINYLGAIGAAIATAISFFAVLLVRLVTIQKIVRIRISYLRSFISFILLFLLCFAYSYEFQYFYFVYVIFLILLVVLNIREIIKLVKSVVLLLGEKRKNI